MIGFKFYFDDLQVPQKQIENEQFGRSWKKLTQENLAQLEDLAPNGRTWWKVTSTSWRYHKQELNAASWKRDVIRLCAQNEEVEELCAWKTQRDRDKSRRLEQTRVRVTPSIARRSRTFATVARDVLTIVLGSTELSSVLPWDFPTVCLHFEICTSLRKHSPSICWQSLRNDVGWLAAALYLKPSLTNAAEY